MLELLLNINTYSQYFQRHLHLLTYNYYCILTISRKLRSNKDSGNYLKSLKKELNVRTYVIL